MATTRLLRASSNPKLKLLGADSSSPSSSGVRCLAAKGGFNNGGEFQNKRFKNGDEMKKLQMGAISTNTHHVKPSMAAASWRFVLTSEPKQRIDGGILDLVSSVSTIVKNALLVLVREGSKRRSLNQNIQMIIETVRVKPFFFFAFLNVFN